MQEINLEKYYIGASYLVNISPIFKSSLFEFLDYDIKKFWEANDKTLDEFAYNYPHISIPKKFLSQKEEINLDEKYENIKNSNVKYITYDDEFYPELLKQIQDFPLLLYYQGKISKKTFKNTLAIVGSRNSTQEAKVVLERIISEMKNSDITIVSGLAMGIDGVAHSCALKNNLKTIGVIASGHNYQYPSTNKYLYDEMVKDNLILSEFPPEVAPQNYYFPQRNRIVTGLCEGTLVVEAKIKSGAMISANLALEQGRELMCTPGSLLNKNTEGIYKLLKSGATIVTEASDIFQALNLDFSASKTVVQMSIEENMIYNVISTEAKTLEEIQKETDYSSSELMVLLTGLELKSLIKQTRGKYFITG